jgi:hypothetical protein
MGKPASTVQEHRATEAATDTAQQLAGRAGSGLHPPAQTAPRAR